MYQCKKCKRNQPKHEYEIINKEKGWFRKECKACVASRTKRWRDISKENLKKSKRDYYERNKEQEIRRATLWNKKHKERRKEISLNSYYKAQYDAVMAYGGFICACCGESEPMFMTLDHIHNDGKTHREVLGTKGGRSFYKKLKDQNYPAGLQVLCMNCNHGKYRNNGICPHQERATTIPTGSTAKLPEAHTILQG